MLVITVHHSEDLLRYMTPDTTDLLVVDLHAVAQSISISLYQSTSILLTNQRHMASVPRSIVLGLHHLTRLRALRAQVGNVDRVMACKTE